MEDDLVNPNEKDCPITTPEFCRRLLKLEKAIEQSRLYRHERNEHIASVIDEERKNRMLLENKVDGMDEGLNRLTALHREVLDLLKGTWGRDGMAAEHELNKRRLEDLEDWQKTWKRDSRLFLSGVIAVGSGIGAVAYYVIQTFIQIFYNRS